jgi:aminopeptidase N
VSVSVFSPPGRGEQGRFAMDVATKCLDFYDEFFQVPYPLPKLDMCELIYGIITVCRSMCTCVCVCVCWQQSCLI